MDANIRIQNHLMLILMAICSIALSPLCLAQTQPTGSRIETLLRNTVVDPTAREFGAVALIKEVTIELDEKVLDRAHFYSAVQVFDHQACADYAEIQHYYNSHNTKLELDFAYVRYPDGRMKEVSDDAIQIKTIPQARLYSDLKIFSLALPTLKPGAVFEYQFTETTIQQSIPNHWDNRFLFNKIQDRPLSESYRIDPVVLAQLIIRIPVQRTLTYASENIQLKPEIQNRNGRRTYLWTGHDIPGIPVEAESGALIDTLPKIIATTTSDWKKLHDWAFSLFDTPAHPTLQLKKIALQASKDFVTQKDKIKALFYLVQDNVEYIAASLDGGSIRPHSAEEVWKNRYGDCKDKTMLLVALLRSIDVEAYPTLINILEEGMLNPQLPMFHFKHMITYVPNVDQGLWLDNSDNAMAFSGLDWSYQDRWAFVIDGKEGKLIKTPSSQAADNQLQTRIDYDFSGRNLVGRLTINTSGAFNYRLKTMLRTNPERDELLRQMAQSVIPQAKVVSSSFSQLQNPKTPLSAHVKFSLDDALGIDGDHWQIFSALWMVSNFTNLATLPPPEIRKTAYVIQFPQEISTQIRISAPSTEHEANILSPSYKVDTPQFSFKASTEKSAHAINVNYRLTLHRSRVEPEDYKAFFQAIHNSLKRSEIKVAFIKNASLSGYTTAPPPQLDNSEVSFPQARRLLQRGQYISAKIMIEKLLANEPNNGEGYYLLGLALGYLDDFEASALAFKNARKLGYRP